MNPIIRRALAIIGVVSILIASLFAWAYIEIGFDGCCGAPDNYTNDSAQSLTHIGAYALAIAFIWLALWWGWKKPNGQR